MKMGWLEKLFVNRAGHSQRVAQHAEQLVRLADPRPGQRFLDVGCGNGAVPVHLVRTFELEATGVAVDPEQIEAAKARTDDLERARSPGGGSAGPTSPGRRPAEFLRALGWPEAPESEPAHRVFQCTNGVVVALYAAVNYEPHFGPPAGGFRAFTLGVNVGSPDEVDTAYAQLQEIDGAELLEEPFDSPHGFRGFSFRDPEGNIWDVAWKRGSDVSRDGDLRWA